MSLGNYNQGIGQVVQGPEGQAFVTTRNSDGGLISKPVGTLTTEDYMQILQSNRSNTPMYGSNGGSGNLGKALMSGLGMGGTGAAAGGAGGLGALASL